MKMADRRRRRSDESSHSESEASADEATEIPTLQKNKKELRKDSECLSEGEGVEVTGEGEDSEYESAEEDQDEEDDEEEEDEEEYDDEDSVIIEDEDGEELGEERQSGDGEEQPASSRELDDDEDRKNPAFVPRKGNFYEHDSRMGSEEIKEEEDRPKKTLWKDEGKWLHDKFYDDMQAPKSKEEIIAMYGYDIRAYDKPPEAPRRFNSSRDGGYRKRNTKLSDFVNEEDMPRQRRGPPRGRGGRGRGRGRGERRRPEDSGWRESRTYSDLQNNTQGRSNEFKNPPVPQRQWTNANFRKSNRDQNYDQDNNTENSNNISEPSPRKEYQDVQRPDIRIELKEDSRKVMTQSDNRTSTVSSSEGGGGSDRKSYARDRRFKGGAGHTRSQDSSSSAIEQGMEQLSVTEEQNKPKQGAPLQQRTPSPGNAQNKGNWSAAGGRGGFPAPPKVDASQNRPKRYSSQRQRNMPESSYQEGGGEQGQQFYNTSPQSGYQPPSTHGGNMYPEPRAPLPRHQVPQHVVRPQVAYTIPGPTPQIQSPPRLLTPPVVTMATGLSTQSLMQPAFIQQGVVNFAGPPPPHYQIAGHIPLQGFPSPPAPPQQAPVPQQELYTAGGVTYYNPESQQPVTPRRSGTIYYNPEVQQQHSLNRSPVRRPKVPLPIIHPEELSKSGEDVEQHEYENAEYEDFSQTDEVTDGSEYPNEQALQQQEQGSLSSNMQDEKTSDLTSHHPGDDNRQPVDCEGEQEQEQTEKVIESEGNTQETD